MEIVNIYKDYLYSIQFDEEDLNEFDRIFEEWHNLDFLVKFFTENAEALNTDFWKEAGLDANNPELSAQRVIDEANELEEYIMKQSVMQSMVILPTLTSISNSSMANISVFAH